MKLRIVLLAASAFTVPLALSSTAKAQPVTGLYVGAGAGYTWENRFRVNDLYGDGYAPGSFRITTHDGYVGEASVGYGFGDGFRVEIEGNYNNNRFDKTSYYGYAAKTGGDEQKYGAFVNGYYDFNIGLPYLYPYLGAGVGYQFANGNNFTISDFGVNANKTKGALAYQGMAGIAIPITYVPGLSATVEYRYTALAGSRKYDASYFGYSAQGKVLRESTNSVLLGLRYAFGVAAPVAPAPAPAPVAAPAPVPAKSYLVFFDWDKADLTPRATDIISQAASDSKTQQTTTIDVSGYTDTSGTPQYNMGLSERRAQAVAAQLVSDGVAQSEISIHAYGETHLLVQTGPGVREPQNRRVEIVLD